MPDVIKDRKAQTAQILAFSPRTKALGKTMPVYVVGTDIEYKPSKAEAKQNELVEQILDLYDFPSKQEQIANQKSS